jgi:hypothetical protein
MNQLVYSQRLSSQELNAVELIKQAFWATPLGLFISAFKAR